MVTPYHLERITILDGDGQPIGAKARQSIDRTRDILHTVFVFLVTGERKFALSVIPRDSALPKLYPGKFGVTVAALVFENEAPDDAAVRALRDEVKLDGCTPIFLGKTLHRYADGVTRLQSAYCQTTDAPTLSFNDRKIAHLTYLTRRELEAMRTMTPHLFAPTFHVLWDTHHAALPF